MIGLHCQTVRIHKPYLFPIRSFRPVQQCKRVVRACLWICESLNNIITKLQPVFISLLYYWTGSFSETQHGLTPDKYVSDHFRKNKQLNKQFQSITLIYKQIPLSAVYKRQIEVHTIPPTTRRVSTVNLTGGRETPEIQRGGRGPGGEVLISIDSEQWCLSNHVKNKQPCLLLMSVEWLVHQKDNLYLSLSSYTGICVCCTAILATL